MILTRKIQIIPIANNKEEFNNIYKTLRNYSYQSWKMSNEIINVLYNNLYLKILIKEKQLNKDLIKDIYKVGSEMNISYTLTKKYNIPSIIRASTSQVIRQAFQNDIKEILKGNKSIRNYKRESFPIYFMIDKKRDTFNINENKYIFNFLKDLKFKLHFGRDKSNNKIIIDRIIDKEYSFCNSLIKIIKNKIFLYLSFKQPESINQLDKDTIIGIDMGYSNLAVCGLNNGLDRLFLGKNDSENSIQNIRKIMINKKRNLIKYMKLAKGSHGRKRKMRTLNNYNSWEKNYMKTKNHQISVEIIKFALKNNAETIQMEKLKGIKDEVDNNWFKRHWTYYQLQQMIEYKAKMNGIEVRYINPAYTSKICSKCGVINKDLKLEDRIYKCDCGNLLDRDYNASVNIARSTSYVKK